VVAALGCTRSRRQPAWPTPLDRPPRLRATDPSRCRCARPSACLTREMRIPGPRGAESAPAACLGGLGCSTEDWSPRPHCASTLRAGRRLGSKAAHACHAGGDRALARGLALECCACPATCGEKLRKAGFFARASGHGRGGGRVAGQPASGSIAGCRAHTALSLCCAIRAAALRPVPPSGMPRHAAPYLAAAWRGSKQTCTAIPHAGRQGS
jgi:hypothetical protein